MSELNERLEEVVEFLYEGEGSNKEIFIAELLGEIKDLNKYMADEMTVNWGSEELMVLDDFVNEFHDKLIEKICNAINSFKDK